MDQELCEKFQVSRTPFREAELALAQRRLIDIRPKIGTYVSYIDAGLVEEVRHLRSVLESELAVMACKKLGREELDGLWENLAVWQMYIKKARRKRFFCWISSSTVCCTICADALTGMSWWKAFPLILIGRPF